MMACIKIWAKDISEIEQLRAVIKENIWLEEGVDDVPQAASTNYNNA